MAPETWIIIPACNEEKEIVGVIKKVKDYSDKIIVVDDGSKDKTNELAKSEGVIVLQHIVNMGKGAALKTGCDYALDKGAKKFVVIDADAQHDPDEIPKFVKALEDADIVFGFRKISKTMPLVLRIGNKIINLTTKLLFHISIKDSQCGYRAFTSEAYKKIRWLSSDYFVETEMIANAGKHKLRCKEVPIETIYSDKYKGTTIIDGLKIVSNMFWLKFSK